MFPASRDGHQTDSCAENGWGPPPDEGDHFDWAEFEKLVARDPGQPCPSRVPAPTGCPSGPFAAHLDSGTVDPDRLADAEIIDAVVGFEHLLSWAGARQTRLLAEFTRRRPAEEVSEMPRSTSRWAPDEVALALSQSRITAAVKLAQATQLSQVLGDTLTAWETGRLDAAKVRAICDATLRLDPVKARAVQARVLPRAGTQSLSQFKAALKRAVLAVDPDDGDERHRKAHNERRVVLTPVDDGMATLWACMTAPDAQTCYGWLTALARGLGQADPRGMDARRLDLMRDLLTGRLTIIPTDPAGGDTVPAPEPGSSPPSSAHPSDTQAAGTHAAGSPTTGTRSTDSHGAGTANGANTTGTESTSTESTSTESTGTTSRGASPTRSGSTETVGAATDSTTDTTVATTAVTTTGEATGTDPAATTDGAKDGAAVDSPTDPTNRTTSGDSDGDSDGDGHVVGGHEVGGPGCTCPTGPPSPPVPPPPLPWRPTPVTPGKPLVQIVIPFTTLTGADDQPVELVGYGPIPAAMARTLTADSVWKRLITDPVSGTLLDHGRTTYRPPAALGDFVRARDQVCRFPPCQRRALDIELDHTISWTVDDGPTADQNLYGACPHHHHLKHDAPGWTVAQTPDGLITWTTPTGHCYTSRPYDYRPEPAPPAPAAKITKEPVPVRRVLPDPWTHQPGPGPDDAPF